MVSTKSLPIGSITEVDDHEIPDWIMNMTEEELISEMKHLVNQVCKKLKRGLSPDIIAAETEEDLDYINEICSVAMRPEYSYDVDKIFEALQENRKLTSTV